MTRKECLDMAAQCVLQDRASQYGGVEDNFRTISNFWSVYLGRKVYPADVAMMMALLKIARIRGNKAHADSFVDLAGYAACGAECAGTLKAREEAVHGPGEECHRFREQEPEFKPGEKVEVHAMTERDVWEPATVAASFRDKNSCDLFYSVGFADGRARMVPSSQVRSAPKAEGVEELVVSPFDAPQPKEAL